jgi:hypothetical protein
MKMATMRAELAPSGSSAGERLLADKAALCWLHLEVLEYEAAHLFQYNHHGFLDTRRADYIDRPLAKAQTRFSEALIALAKIRRLAIQAVQVNQVNVGDTP